MPKETPAIIIKLTNHERGHIVAIVLTVITLKNDKNMHCALPY